MFGERVNGSNRGEGGREDMAIAERAACEAMPFYSVVKGSCRDNHGFWKGARTIRSGNWEFGMIFLESILPRLRVAR